MFLKPGVVLLGVVTVLAVMGAGCTGPAPAPQNRSFSLNEYDFNFSVKTIEVNQNDVLTINVTNNGTMAHDFTIGAPYSINQAVPVGTTQTIHLTASTKGSFEYVCSIAGHKELGMVGTLKVN
jgi:plastocyanin